MHGLTQHSQRQILFSQIFLYLHQSLPVLVITLCSTAVLLLKAVIIFLLDYYGEPKYQLIMQTLQQLTLHIAFCVCILQHWVLKINFFVLH